MRAIQIELIKFLNSGYNVEIVSGDIRKLELNALVLTFTYNSFKKRDRYQRIRKDIIQMIALCNIARKSEKKLTYETRFIRNI